MTREEAVRILRKEIECMSHTKCSDCILEKVCDPMSTTPLDSEYIEVFGMAIRALEQEPCEDAINRADMLDAVGHGTTYTSEEVQNIVNSLSSVTPQQKMGRCKDCKYFEYDGVVMVDGIPLIVAHEICSRWGDGCKTKEDGYCFLFEPQESEE